MFKNDESRDKLFPGKIRICDLKNNRYISRKPIYDFLVENKNQNGKLLDFGCGSMQYRELFNNVEEYYGLDIEGAEKNGFCASNVIYYDGKIIPFEKNSFDTVIAIEVLEHVEDLELSLSEINRVLKPNGKFIFTVPMTFPLHLEPWDYRRFTRYGIENELKKAGFSEIVIQNSTCASDTIRRMKIIEKGRRKGKIKRFFYKKYIIYANVMFALNRKKSINSKFPIDYLVICKKE